jgi:hypothetical protein
MAGTRGLPDERRPARVARRPRRESLRRRNPGAFQSSWTIKDVAGRTDEIGDAGTPLVFKPVPSGFAQHLGYSFEMARANEGQQGRSH